MRKKVVLSVLLFAASFGSANAQSLLELLYGKPASTTGQTEKPAVEKINLDALKGEWKYAGAAVEFTGTDIVSVLGSSVAAPHIKQSLETYYARMGVVPGSCTLEFGDKELFAARTATHSVEGPYKFDAQAQKVQISYDHPELGGRNTLDGKLSFTGECLTLSFEAAGIVAIIKKMTKDMALEQNIEDLIDMISEYPGLYLGFTLEK